MNPRDLTDQELDDLLARARRRRPDTARAEYGFETRLLARLRSADPVAAAWGTLSWRMVPFFAIFVVGLAIWHAQVVTETRDAQQIDYLAHGDAGDAMDNSN